MTRQPISKLEKFVDGLNKLLVLQPASKIEITEGKFFVGDLEDPHLRRGMRDYMVNMGFSIEDNRFVFETTEVKKYAKY